MTMTDDTQPTPSAHDLAVELEILQAKLDVRRDQPGYLQNTIDIETRIAEIRERYKSRRDVLIDGLRNAGWEVPSPAASMFAWAPIPEQFRGIGTMAFSKLLLERANVAVAPGVGFGEYGEGFVRVALVENNQRLRQATRNIKAFLSGRNDSVELRRAAAAAK